MSQCSLICLDAKEGQASETVWNTPLSNHGAAGSSWFTAFPCVTYCFIMFFLPRVFIIAPLASVLAVYASLKFVLYGLAISK